MLPVPDVTDLAIFSGRPVPSYPGYVSQALANATLLFSVASGLDVWPDDPDLTQVGVNAILEMADKLVLEQPYQSVKASPFQNETIGSYSYSKGYGLARATAVGAQVTENLGSNLYWWHIALDLLGTKKTLLTASGSIKVHEEGLVRTPDGVMRIKNAVEQEGPDRPPYVEISKS